MCVQVEGAKRWRLHPPLDAAGVLPRFSSADLAAGDLAPPFLDVVLDPGDLLYMPRGPTLRFCLAWLHTSARLPVPAAASACKLLARACGPCT